MALCPRALSAAIMLFALLSAAMADPWAFHKIHKVAYCLESPAQTAREALLWLDLISESPEYLKRVHGKYPELAFMIKHHKVGWDLDTMPAHWQPALQQLSEIAAIFYCGDATTPQLHAACLERLATYYDQPALRAVSAERIAGLRSAFCSAHTDAAEWVAAFRDPKDRAVGPYKHQVRMWECAIEQLDHALARGLPLCMPGPAASAADEEEQARLAGGGAAPAAGGAAAAHLSPPSPLPPSQRETRFAAQGADGWLQRARNWRRVRHGGHPPAQSLFAVAATAWKSRKADDTTTRDTGQSLARYAVDAALRSPRQALQRWRPFVPPMVPGGAGRGFIPR